MQGPTGSRVGRRSLPSVSLNGSPAAVGARFGSLHAAAIRRETADYAATAPREALISAARAWCDLASCLAPHWLEEMAAAARAAGVDAELFAAWQASKYRGVNRPPVECFTYCALPALCEGGVLLFHKNRDNRAAPQAAYVKHIEVPGRRIFRFASTGNCTDLGCMMGVNEAGLCAAADMGGPDPNPRFRGMMNPDVLRLILEEASTVEEAESRLRLLHDQEVCAGGAVGTNWMFADAAGHALRVVQLHAAYEIALPRDGILTMRDQDPRAEQVRSALAARPGTVTAAMLNAVARREPVLHPTNVSSMTVRVTPIRPDLFTCAEFALRKADETVYIPLYLGCAAVSRALLDGSAHASTPGPDARPKVEAFERQIAERRRLLEQSAASALAGDGEGAARRILTDGSARLASLCLGFLGQAGSAAL